MHVFVLAWNRLVGGCCREGIHRGLQFRLPTWLKRKKRDVGGTVLNETNALGNPPYERKQLSAIYNHSGRSHSRQWVWKPRGV